MKPKVTNNLRNINLYHCYFWTLIFVQQALQIKKWKMITYPKDSHQLASHKIFKKFLFFLILIIFFFHCWTRIEIPFGEYISTFKKKWSFQHPLKILTIPFLNFFPKKFPVWLIKYKFENKINILLQNYILKRIFLLSFYL